MSHPIAYTFKADIYCPSCINPELTSSPKFEGWQLVSGVRMSTEADLDEIAYHFGINRHDEQTFDSDDFPKVVFSIDPDHSICGRCHEEI